MGKCLSLGVASLALPALCGVGAESVDLGSDPYFPDDPADICLVVPKYSPKNNEIETVAACLVLEAASQGSDGMRGVMSVIRNRSRGLPELFVSTVLRPKQFSSFNRVTAGRESLWRALQRAKSDQMWNHAVALVREASGEKWNDTTGGATHFTRSGERNRWTRNLKRTTTIDTHAFYK